MERLSRNTSCQTTLATFSSHRQTTCSPPRASTLVPQQAASPKGHQAPKNRMSSTRNPSRYPAPGAPLRTAPRGRCLGMAKADEEGTKHGALRAQTALPTATSELPGGEQVWEGGDKMASVAFCFVPPPLLSPLSLSLRAAENNTIAEVWERNQLVNGRSLSPVFRPAARRAQLLQRSNQSGAIWLITRLSEAGSRCKKAGNALLAASAPATPSQTQTQDLSYTLRS